MGPEKYIQNEIVLLLRRRGYIVIRAGFNGYPDVIALRPEGENIGWYTGKSTGGHYIKWPVRDMFVGKGLGLYPFSPDTKLFLEIKKEGGTVNPRQKHIIDMLGEYGVSAVVDSVDTVKRLIEVKSSHGLV